MRLIALIPALLLSTAAFAEAPISTNDLSKATPGAYSLEKNHASITFKVLHMGFSNYTMRFNDFDADILLDPAKPENSKVNATIRPGSLDSNNEKLTEHAGGADLLDVAKYPTITFVSTKVEKLTPTTGKITGDLTLHGVTKPIVLNATFNGTGANPMSKVATVGFSATTVVKRSEFGMDQFLGMVGDDITVAIETEFTKK